MARPTIKVLGVYSVPVTQDLIREQTDTLYGTELSENGRREAEERTREQLASTVLVEVLVQNRDDRFQLRDFTQSQEGVPKDNWQAPWAEAYLSEDGESLLVERWSDPPGTANFRAAFFIHGWDLGSPLLSSYGELSCPPLRDMPARLKKLVPYEPVD